MADNKVLFENCLITGKPIKNKVVQKTYQILLPMSVEEGADKTSIKEAVYAYLKELIDDDFLYFTEVKER